MKPTLRPGQRAPEQPRDEDESAFTPILRQAWRADPSTRCVLFVDREGECIDYVSSTDPFEAKVAGAHGLVLLNALRDTRERLDYGEPHGLEIISDHTLMWARRVSDDYAVILVADVDADRYLLDEVVTDACRSFRQEVGIPTPSWEAPPRTTAAGQLRVSVRPAVGWPYAPTAVERDGERTEIAAVLGRWTEGEDGRGLVCFRVRSEAGREFTLAHDPRHNRWRTLDV